MAKWFFYERVSTKQQKLDRQIYNIELEKFCGRMGITIDDLIVLPEKQSGKDFSRPQYQLLKQVARTGDNIIVCSMDRFGRNYIEGRKEFSEFIGKGIKVYALNRPMLEELYKLDDSASKFMINFLMDWELMNAEDELKRMKTRQKEGLDAAKKNNKKFGRPKIQKPDNFDEVYRLWKDKKITAVSAMKKLNLKKNTFYKLVKENEVDG